MSQLEVDKVIPQSGTTLTLGESGDTITIASGATFTPTLTAPIIDEINDTNGNEEIIFTTTTSAVNELTIANAATGNAPEIAATGDDTDIDLKLTPKGAGNLVLDGIEFPNADGSASQVLQTNGSGVLSFATVGGGVSNSFQAVGTGGGGNITGALAVNTELHDDGGNYNTANGRYTAPSTGYYIFFASALIDGASGTDLYFTKNGSAVSATNSWGYNGVSNQNQLNIYGILSLTSGDYVNIFSSQTVYVNQFLNFGGAKLY
jgi:hypothetical protein